MDIGAAHMDNLNTPQTKALRLRILIVDDNAQVRQDLQTVLMLASSPAGFSIDVIDEAANGKEAVQKIGVLRPDVILMDLAMPVLDGYQATQQIKQHDPSCRVIALTIHDDEATRQKAIQCGIDDIVIKGAPVETLLEAISQSKQDETFQIDRL